ncbi:ThuA domain-containing protein [Cellulosimicrobium arenosum]|uniref:ThuA domain-containing protein n=1 Tax=Cellulosimicrobium arenosum TaxID=2708133 RepID=A0A927G9R5_9MICO|nr:ThuA domain-containing protein [Cellulosimicrobium arenosum]MBD8079396.1 ThuA domain-containing protein [Cellulosimicrobium arenosum]
MTSASRALVLAGRGRYEDPWHDHAATSHVVALLLAEEALDVQVRGTVPGAFADLRAFDLVVVNAGRGRPDPAFDGDDAAWAPAHAAVRAYAADGGALLGLHQAANTFADDPHWPDLLGGRWVPGTSWHPPQDVATFTAAGDHPVTDGLGPVVADDERYLDLVVDPGSRVLLTAHHDGSDHPVAWVSGGARAVYDGLGHGVESYGSASRRELLRREVDWLLAR